MTPSWRLRPTLGKSPSECAGCLQWAEGGTPFPESADIVEKLGFL
jgi:hypothetical protein